MPTITPQSRVSIGSDQPAAQRSTLKVATGINLPVPPEKTGQQNITEETPAQEVTLSPQLTAFARKQQKLQAEIQAQREKESAWEKEKAKYVDREGLKAKVQQNAAEALAELGITYDELTNLMLAQQQGDDPVKQLASEVASLKKSHEESTNKLFEQTVSQYRSEAAKMIAAEDKYLMLRDEPEAAKAAIDELLEDFDKTGETKDISYYLDLAEEGLRDLAKGFSSRLEKISKPKEAETAQEKKTLPPPPRASTRTLTRQVETTPTRSYGQFQHLSPRERIAQAIARTQK